ncbi:MAG TPA: hypothetical protein PLF42_00865 [Anaerolineales bacterium]|nr:hypothetical protein [Anaerolineales bacterium]
MMSGKNHPRITRLFLTVMVLLACGLFPEMEPTPTPIPPTATFIPTIAPTPTSTPILGAVVCEKFLTAINDNNLDLADGYVCESQQGRLAQRLLREKSMHPKGNWIEVVKTPDGGHGVTSPGLTNIKCEDSAGGDVVCAFLRPEASCNMSIRDGQIAGFNCYLKGGLSTEVIFKFDEGKICDYVFREP